MAKKILSILFVTIMAFTLLSPAAVYADENVRYVAEGGTGDGRSVNSPIGDLADAIEDLATSGGTIVIVGEYDLAGSRAFIAGKNGTLIDFSEPVHSGAITITGKHGGMSYGGKLKANNDTHYCLSGDTKFEYISFEGSGGTYLFAARYNALTFGKEFDISTFTRGAYIIGGYNNGDVAAVDAETGMNYAGVEERDVNINIESGSFLYVIGLNRYLASSKNLISFENKVNINISGEALVERVFGGNYDNLILDGGDCTVNVSDDSCIMMLYTDNKLAAEGGLGSLTLNINSASAVVVEAKFGAYTKTELVFDPAAADAAESVMAEFGTVKTSDGSAVTAPPETEPVTERPATQPVTSPPTSPVTEPPATEPPVTEAPATVAPVTDPEETTAPATSAPAPAPAAPKDNSILITVLLFAAAAVIIVIAIFLPKLTNKKQ